ncbi:MAG: hypothetical protein NWE89_06470, partial [Candidatus Bathyarchaeota archaeon]|nr:hypothetical protein [Candidatus Bathyarchaeota archaeon]
INLDHGDLKEITKIKEEFYFLKTLTQKTGSRAQTVLGPESLNALRDWFKLRESRGEILEDSTPVFNPYKLRDKNPKNKAKVNPELNKQVRSQTRIDRRSASTIISRIFDNAGFPTVTAHGLRKLHNTYLTVGSEDERVTEPMLNRLEGREIPNSTEAYKLYPPEKLIEAYSKAYHNIQVYPSESKEVSDLQTRVNSLETTLEENIKFMKTTMYAVLEKGDFSDENLLSQGMTPEELAKIKTEFGITLKDETQ